MGQKRRRFRFRRWIPRSQRQILGRGFVWKWARGKRSGHESPQWSVQGLGLERQSEWLEVRQVLGHGRPSVWKVWDLEMQTV